MQVASNSPLTNLRSTTIFSQRFRSRLVALGFAVLQGLTKTTNVFCAEVQLGAELDACAQQIDRSICTTSEYGP